MRRTLEHLAMRCVQEMSVTTTRLTTKTATIRASSRVQVTVEFHVVLRVVSLDLGFHVVIGVRRLNIQQDGFISSTAFHHAYAIPSAKFFPSGCVSCHRQLNLNPKFLHISHREDGSFEVLSSHNKRYDIFRLGENLLPLFGQVLAHSWR